jgi:acyl-homoserine lactone acylase PvdQ
VRYTHRGPVLSYIVSPVGAYDVRKDDLSLSWTGFNQDYSSVAIISRNQEASSLAELMYFLDEGTKYYISISALAVTSDDHIIYAQFGLNPRRANSRMASYIKNGTITEYDWRGFMPARDKLFVVDPECGYIVTCNNRPASTIFQGGYFQEHIFTARGTRI